MVLCNKEFAFYKMYRQYIIIILILKTLVPKNFGKESLAKLNRPFQQIYYQRSRKCNCISLHIVRENNVVTTFFNFDWYLLNYTRLCAYTTSYIMNSKYDSPEYPNLCMFEGLKNVEGWEKERVLLTLFIFRQ